MKKTLLFLFCVALSVNSVIAQNAAGKVKWTVGEESMPTHIQAFQENKGQFTSTASNWKIEFGADYMGSYILFTDHGIINVIPEAVPLTEAEKEAKEKTEGKRGVKEGSPEEQNEKKVIYHTVTIEWEGANASAVAEGINETSYHFGALDPVQRGKSVDNIKGYKKIVYHNLYPGIDVEFTFHKDKGIEYTLNVKPGFDASVFKMKYSGQKGLTIDEAGNIHLATPMGDIIDHAPVSSQNGKNISSSFEKIGDNEIDFKLDNYDKTEALIIDPWLVSPTTGLFVPYDCSMDAGSNVYVMGSVGTGTSSSSITMYVQKFTTSGALSWTYKLSQYYKSGASESQSDMTVDTAGNTYIPSSYSYSDTLGQQYAMIKLNPIGALSYFYNTYPGTYTIFETWNVAFSLDYSTLIEAGCPNIYQQQMAIVNPANGTLGGYSANTTDQLGEIYTGCFAPNGYYYAINANPDFCPTSTTADSLVCYSVAGGVTKELWSTSTEYGYDDYNFKSMYSIPTNGIAAGCSYLYTSDGYHLDQRSLTNGVSIKRIIIPGGDTSECNSSWVTGAIPANSGIAVDPCGNVYIGSYGEIIEYDQNLNLITTNGAYYSYVFDVAYHNGLVAACGANGAGGNPFVTQYAPGLCSGNNFTISSTNTSCGNNNGTASVVTSGSYTYLWSPGGQTTQTVTGLAPGIYTVTVNGLSACTTTFVSDTVTIHASTPIDVTTSASGGCTGTVNVAITGGELPYSYVWSNGATSSSVSGLGTGIYTVTVTDAYGCVQTDTTTVPSAVIAITPVKHNDSCYGDSNGVILLNVTGGSLPYTYTWVGGQTTSNISGLIAGTYTCTVKENGGCTGTLNIIVSEPAVLKDTVVNAAICEGSCTTISAIVTGGTAAYSYAWGISTNSSVTVCPLVTTTYTNAVTDSKGCSAVSSGTVTVNPLPSVTMGIASDSICSTDTIDALTGTPSGGVFNGVGVTGSNFNPRTAGIGKFSINYSYTNSTGCSNTYVLNVTVISCVTGIDNVQDLNTQISFYPSPFSQSMNINVGIKGPVNITLFNMLGQDVGDWVLDKGLNTINTQLYPPGVYVVQVRTKAGVLNKKLIKVN